jgi:hypothetical protein
MFTEIKAQNWELKKSGTRKIIRFSFLGDLRKVYIHLLRLILVSDSISKPIFQRDVNGS